MKKAQVFTILFLVGSLVIAQPNNRFSFIKDSFDYDSLIFKSITTESFNKKPTLTLSFYGLKESFDQNDGRFFLFSEQVLNLVVLNSPSIEDEFGIIYVNIPSKKLFYRTLIDEALAFTAFYYMKNGEFDSAADYFKKAVAIAPSKINHRYNLGECALRIKDLNLSMEQFETIVSNNPELWKGYFGLGKTQHEMGNYSEAVSNLKKCFELSKGLDYKKRANIKYKIGKSQLANEEIEEAKETFLEALDIDSNERYALYNLGVIYLETNKKKACKYLEKSSNIGFVDAENLLRENCSK